MTEIPEVTAKDFARAIPARLRKRLMSGHFESGADISALRRFVGLTQTQFARAMGISVHTLRNWEQGRRQPDGPAIALLRIAADHSGESRVSGLIAMRGVVILERVNTLADRITVDPEQCGGRPCIRGMRIRVSDVLDLFAAGLTAQEILAEMRDLEAEDLQASLRFASRWLDHPVLVA
jgi:uncharacterized protein (DUF433 family)/DNA-binding transcriptional regulator YiaG